MSRIIADPRILEAFAANPLNTYFVSFPRTGCHWFRALTELYLQRPGLTLTFAVPGDNWYACATHDLDLALQRKRVVYIVREPVHTVFSNLCYYLTVPPQAPAYDQIDQYRTMAMALQYAAHLRKWLLQETFTERKTIVSYDRARLDAPSEFQKICAHYEVPFEAGRFAQVLATADKAFVQQHTQHDPKVVNPTPEYRAQQSKFSTTFSSAIWDVLHEVGVDRFLRV